jgi:DNA-binding XRE family transcriptional regulator
MTAVAATSELPFRNTRTALALNFLEVVVITFLSLMGEVYASIRTSSIGKSDIYVQFSCPVFGYSLTLSGMTIVDYAVREMLDCPKIKRLREELRLSQEQAGEAAGFKAGRSHWNDIESGRRANVTLETLGKLAKALGVDPAELLKTPKRRGAK